MTKQEKSPSSQEKSPSLQLNRRRFIQLSLGFLAILAVPEIVAGLEAEPRSLETLVSQIAELDFTDPEQGAAGLELISELIALVNAQRQAEGKRTLDPVFEAELNLTYSKLADFFSPARANQLQQLREAVSAVEQNLSSSEPLARTIFYQDWHLLARFIRETFVEPFYDEGQFISNYNGFFNHYQQLPAKLGTRLSSVPNPMPGVVLVPEVEKLAFPWSMLGSARGDAEYQPTISDLGQDDATWISNFVTDEKIRNLFIEIGSLKMSGVLGFMAPGESSRSTIILNPEGIDYVAENVGLSHEEVFHQIIDHENTHLHSIADNKSLMFWLADANQVLTLYLLRAQAMAGLRHYPTTRTIVAEDPNNRQPADILTQVYNPPADQLAQSVSPYPNYQYSKSILVERISPVSEDFQENNPFRAIQEIIATAFEQSGQNTGASCLDLATYLTIRGTDLTALGEQYPWLNQAFTYLRTELSQLDFAPTTNRQERIPWSVGHFVEPTPGTVGYFDDLWQRTLVPMAIAELLIKDEDYGQILAEALPLTDFLDRIIGALSSADGEFFAELNRVYLLANRQGWTLPPQLATSGAYMEQYLSTLRGYLDAAGVVRNLDEGGEAVA